MEEIKEREKIDFKYNLRVYWSLVSKYKFLFFGVLVLVLILEAQHTVVKYLFKIVVDKGSSFSAGSVTLASFTSLLTLVLIIYLALTVAKFGLKWIHIHFINLLDANVIIDLKQKFFNHIVHLSHNFHITHKTGSLISRLNRGGGSVERMTDLIVFNVAPLFFQLVVVALAFAYFSIPSMIVAIVTTVVFIIFSFYMQQKQQKANLEHNRAEDWEKGTIADVFTNIDSIKYFGKENIIKNRFAKVSSNSKAAALKNWGYFRWVDAVQSVILAIGTLFIVYFPMKEFLAGSISIGTVVFIYTSFLDLLGPMFGFVHGMRGFYRSMADFQDLFEYGKHQNDIKDAINAKAIKIKEGSVEFKDVTFSYHDKKVLSDINLKINPGEKVALVGHSGCGKTTLVKLLYRFYDLNKGKILIDNNNINDFKQESLRSELSIVPQECILFDDTIYNNILFSSPKASRQEVLSAIRFAQLDGFIKGLPNKENTVVGERGVKLSGGEKQRVSIARAILANKKILVLDEATSALDSQTEHEIQKDLQKLTLGRTSIIIAHRLSTIMKADKIVVMEKGRIIQVGRHSDLISQPGIYKMLWTLQKGGYLKDQ